MQRQFVLRDSSSFTLRWVLPRFGCALLVAIVSLLRVGFHETDPWLSSTMYTIIESLGLIGLASIYVFAFQRRPDRADWMKRHWREPFAVVALLVAYGFGSSVIFLATLGFILVILFTRLYVILTDHLAWPGMLFMTSFLILVLAGTLMLRLPRATPIDQPISWLDALFTSTSAVCVTGLIVRDTATEFTAFGQVIILILIQLGGLGIILFGSLFAVMFGGSVSLRQAATIGEVVESSEFGLGTVDRLVRFIVIAALCTEAVGAGLVYMFMQPTLPEGAAEGQEIFYSVFLSVSAFCNAGFAPYTQSLVDYPSRFTVHLLLPTLIVIGGLGFPVLFNLWQVLIANIRLRFTKSPFSQVHATQLIRLNLHTKVVLSTSIILYLIGVVGIFIGQLSTNWLHPAVAAATAPDGDVNTTMAHCLAVAHFMSVSARTAGFNATEMSEMTSASQYILILLMWVGGSPGSTAGGVKTIVVAILALSAWSTIRGRSETEVFGRAIPFDLVRRAAVAAVISLTVIASATFGLTLTEQSALGQDLFEAVSASSTVGLSMGMTGDLSMAGKWVVIFAMFIGRVGPLAVIGAMVFGAFTSSRQARYQYPQESIIIG